MASRDKESSAAAGGGGGGKSKLPLPAVDLKGWFGEAELMWQGQKTCIQVEKTLHSETSEFQKIDVFQTKAFGRMLVLDGAIQFTEKDEFSYHEMMAGIPINAHHDPRRVLIIGGGDGGVAREVLRYPKVDSVVMCELDPRVTAVSRTFFSKNTLFPERDGVGSQLGHRNLEIEHKDGFKFLKTQPSAHFDVIIVDSSDPVGPAEVLYSSDFYVQCARVLGPGGVLATQGECGWIHMETIKGILGSLKKAFPQEVDYAQFSVPTYPCGQIGVALGCKERPGYTASVLAGLDPAKPVNVRFGKREMLPHVGYAHRYYTPVVHMASFVLPKQMRKELEPLCGANGKPPKPIQLGVSYKGAAIATGVALAAGVAAGAVGFMLTAGRSASQSPAAKQVRR